MPSLLWIIIGLLILVVSGDFLVKGAVSIAVRFKISTLVIGMTVVSFGTSAPELFVSLGAALRGNPEIAVGNVIGSNIANIALVLAITVLIFPLVIDIDTLRIDWPMMFFSSVLFYVFAFDGIITSTEGWIMLLCLLTFLGLLIWNARKKGQSEASTEQTLPTWKTTLFLIGGFVGLYFGSKWLVQGAVEMAVAYDVPKHVIAVTVVAFGTSIPELAASVMAAFRKQTDISVGNLIGSNVFNIMAVIAVTAIVTPIVVEKEVVKFDMIWMLAIAGGVLPLMLMRNRVLGKGQGVLLLTGYIVYLLMVTS